MGDLAPLGFAIAMRADHWQSQVLAEELPLPHHGFARGLESEATLIASGGYVGFLPTHLVEALQPYYRMVEVKGAEHLRYTLTFALVYDRKRMASPAGHAFAQVVRDVHGAHDIVLEFSQFLRTQADVSCAAARAPRGAKLTEPSHGG